jgi:hypothetical protein
MGFHDIRTAGVEAIEMQSCFYVVDTSDKSR